MNLDASPEAIWAQVEAQRARQTKLQATLPVLPMSGPRRATQRWLTNAVLLAMISPVLLGTILFWPHSSSAPPIRIEGNGLNVTYDCSGAAVYIEGNDDSITLRGMCSTVTIEGNDDHVTVSGSTDSVAVEGNDNTLSWTENQGGNSPSITNEGNDNSIGPAGD